MSRSPRKYVVSAAIVLFWIVMTGLLLDREVFVNYAQPGGKPPEPFDTWMGIYPSATADDDSRIGFVHTVSSLESREGAIGTRLQLTVELATTMFSLPTEIVISGSAWNPHEKGIAEFDLKIRSFEHTTRLVGRSGDGRLALEIQTGGETYPLEFPIGEDLLLSGSMGSTTLNFPGLDVGDEVYIDTFDPLTLTKGRARIECIGVETVEAGDFDVLAKIVTAELGGMKTKYWLTDGEEIIRVETPMGLTFRKVTQEEALRSLDGSGAHELFNTMAIRPEGPQPFRGARTMTVKLANLPPGLEPPSGSMQTRTGEGVYVIKRPQDPSRLSGEGRALVDPAAFLTGDPFVPVGHPKIEEQAKAIVAGAEGPWETALKLYEWVYENVEKTVVLSFPSALDVLESLEGDCNEHTVLFTALSRTMALPTRIAIGIVWSEALEAFYYHAWPEVYIDGWIPMDPTLGQPLADATHVKLVLGNVEQWPQLAPYLGRLQLEVLEVE